MQNSTISLADKKRMRFEVQQLFQQQPSDLRSNICKKKFTFNLCCTSGLLRIVEAKNVFLWESQKHLFLKRNLTNSANHQ